MLITTIITTLITGVPKGSRKKRGSIFYGKPVCQDRSPKGAEGEEYVLIAGTEFIFKNFNLGCYQSTFLCTTLK